MQTKTKRILYGIGATVLAATLAIGGTFAYTRSERKANRVDGIAQYQAKLVENYEPKPWEKDVPIPKSVKVANKGVAGKDGDIYVSLQILEFMQTTPVDYNYLGGNENPTLVMIDKSGDYVRFPATGDLTAAINAYNWNNVIADKATRDAFVADLLANTNNTSRFVKSKWFLDDDPTKEYFYIKTQKDDPNGQYGSPLAISRDTTKTPKIITGKQFVEYGSPHADYMANYDIHCFGQPNPGICAEDAHNHAKLEIVNYMWLADYKQAGYSLDNLPATACWILDPATGEAFWSHPVKAGSETLELMKSIIPTTNLEDEMLYDIYIHMQAYSLSELPHRFPYYTASALSFADGTKTYPFTDIDTTKESPNIKGYTEGSDTIIKWDSSDKTVATVDNDGVVTLKGPGETTISVEIKRADDTTETITYKIVVEDEEIEDNTLLTNDPIEPWPINPHDPNVSKGDQARSGVIQLKAVSTGGSNYKLEYYYTPAAQNYAYFPLSHFLPESVLNDSTAIGVNVISKTNGVGAIGTVASGMDLTDRGANPSSPPNPNPLNLTGKRCLAVEFNLTGDFLSEITSLPTSGGLYKTEITIEFTQGTKTSERITIPVMFDISN